MIETPQNTGRSKITILEFVSMLFRLGSASDARMPRLAISHLCGRLCSDPSVRSRRKGPHTRAGLCMGTVGWMLAVMFRIVD